VTAATRLVLWDLDHTLIESRGFGRAIYERVFPRATGKPLRELATVHGRTEFDIIAETLSAHEIPATDHTVARVAEALADGYREARDELTVRGRVLPGARETLARLAAESHVYQTLLTGNTAAVATVKVDAFGLGPFLDLTIGAYGDDNHNRTTLVAVALRRFRERHGIALEIDQAVIIGDTPNDVAAALEAGTQLIAVATGRYSVDELAAAGADLTVADFADSDRLRHALARTGLASLDR
jgi:phosphoglycolate phosphatase